MGQPAPTIIGDTFLRAPRATADELSPGDIGVLGVGHELTKLSRPGVAYGPRAIRDATQMVAWMGERYSRDPEGSTYVDIVDKRAYRFKRHGIYDLGDVPVGPDLDINRARIREAVGAIAKAGAMPMVLGGDHYLTHPATQGVADAEPGKLAFLSLDMHMDVGDDVPEFGRFNGATYLRRLITEGTLDPKRVVIYGVEREVSRDDWEFVLANGIEVIPAVTVFEHGVEATLAPALERILDGADGLYATLDIDVGARSVVPGTGNQNGVIGLSPAEMLQVAAMLAGKPLKGIDVTELSPPLDPAGHTAGLVASMLLAVLRPWLYEEMEFPTGPSG
jgi:agmatinase